jgi:hypothetical protein
MADATEVKRAPAITVSTRSGEVWPTTVNRVKL